MHIRTAKINIQSILQDEKKKVMRYIYIGYRDMRNTSENRIKSDIPIKYRSRAILIEQINSFQ